MIIEFKTINNREEEIQIRNKIIFLNQIIKDQTNNHLSFQILT